MSQHSRVETIPFPEPVGWLEMDDRRVHRLLARLQSTNRALDDLREALEADESTRSAETAAWAEPA